MLSIDFECLMSWNAAAGKKSCRRARFFYHLAEGNVCTIEMPYHFGFCPTYSTSMEEVDFYSLPRWSARNEHHKNIFSQDQWTHRSRNLLAMCSRVSEFFLSSAQRLNFRLWVQKKVSFYGDNAAPMHFDSWVHPIRLPYMALPFCCLNLVAARRLLTFIAARSVVPKR